MPVAVDSIISAKSHYGNFLCVRFLEGRLALMRRANASKCPPSARLPFAAASRGRRGDNVRARVLQALLGPVELALEPMPFLCVFANGGFGQRTYDDKELTCMAGNASPLMFSNLKSSNGLGYRVMGMIQIRCSVPGCGWVGDVAALEEHLLKHASSTSTVTPELASLAKEKYEAGKLPEALALYNKAIAASPNNPGLHYNRAAVHLQMGAHAAAAADCERAIELGRDDAKVRARLCKALLRAGQFAEAASRAGALSPRATTLARMFDEAREAASKGDYARARTALAAVLLDDDAGQSVAAKSLAALVEAHVGNVDSALRLSLDAVRGASRQHPDAWAGRAWALLSNGEFENARQAAKEALRLDPDHFHARSAFRTAKAIEGQLAQADAAMAAKDYATAAQLFGDLAAQSSVVPAASPMRTDMLARRSDALFKSGDVEHALAEATKIVADKDDCLRAWLTRLYCLRELRRYEDMVTDSKALLERWGQSEPILRSLADKAVFELRRSKRPDLYALLGVGPLASEGEIKQAYKAKSLVTHPDKCPPDAPEATRKAMEERFKALGQALDVLGNKEKRDLWDEGYDVEGLEEVLRMRAAHRHRQQGS